MTIVRFALPALVLASGCIIEGSHSSPSTCGSDTSYDIDTGASITHAAGVDAGYYVSYAAGGAWHIEWTCDTKLSAEGCNFTGEIVFDTQPGAPAPTCYLCEDDDIFSSHASGSQTVVDFNTITSTGIDGVDFTSTPGDIISVDLQINSLYQNDLVFLPSDGNTVSPLCMPTDLEPTSP
ncbi:MAG TPA: hypothetical protein VLX92_31800 [Kofleriaceae bacterium]|nr:hypothetical protein [Kofleriaceae bacterium]